MRTGAWSWLLTLAACLGALGGCYGPPPALGPHDPPQLTAIQDAFSAAVRRARAADDASWRSGWHGNMMVNVVGGPNRGLCWQWQQMVYEGVVETVGRLGWDATGVALDAGTANEHHAVLVWDPKRLERSKLLTTPRPRPVWVLDGWRRGEPDLWPLDAWIDSTVPFPSRIELEKLWVRSRPAPVSPLADGPAEPSAGSAAPLTPR
ncbi:MAG: hypothetical protein JNJ48_00825 [Phycisphaerae bacterium]|nr:hypothetical protein [Phycisphaerae bacterium]